MPWLADSDVNAARGSVRAFADARSDTELRVRALEALAALVPSDVLTWDRVDGAQHPTPATAHVDYEIAIGMRAGAGTGPIAVVAALGRTERTFSERDRDMLGLLRGGLEGALQAGEARARLVRALADDPPPGTAIVLLDRDGEIARSGPEAERWLTEHFGAAEHPGWLPAPVAEWLSLPPRPPLVAERAGRRLTVCLLPGDPHALLLEERVTAFRADALARLGLTIRESEVLRAASVLGDETEVAWELFLSPHAVRERLARLEAKLDVATLPAAVACVLREST